MTLPLWAQQIVAVYLMLGAILAMIGITVRQVRGLDRRNRYADPTEVLRALLKIATWPYGIYQAAKKVAKEINDE